MGTKKEIGTLIADIYSLFTSDFQFKPEHVEAFGKRLAEKIAYRVEETKGRPTLRMSNLGTPCLRKLWYQINQPDAGEKLDGKTRFKFLYGDILEELLLFLAESAGHDVKGGQGTLEINGVKGHRDAIIDGVLVDVKSASPYGFKKFAEHGLAGDDPFGYLDQINAYLFASKDDPDLVEKNKSAFLAVEKVMGDLVLDEYPKNDVDYEKRVADLRLMLVQPTPPARYYEDKPDGYWKGRGATREFVPNGNRVLGMECSYCSHKATCWPGLKVHVTGGKPKFFTVIKKALPSMTEETEGF